MVKTKQTPINSEATEVVQALVKQAATTLAEVRGLKVIRSPEVYKTALEHGKQVKAILKEAKAQRAHFLAPFEEGVKRITAHFAQIIDPLTEDEAHIKALASDYMEHERQKELAKAEKKASKLEEEGLLTTGAAAGEPYVV